MCDLLLLSDARRHPFQFAARVGHLALRLFLLRGRHLRQGFGEPPSGAFQDGYRHLQFVPDGDRGGPGRRRLPLRFQKQFRLGEQTLTNHARAVPPGGIELPRLPCVATVLDEGGGQPLTVLNAAARHRHQILHCQLRAQQPFAHLLLNCLRQLFDQRQAPRYPTHTAVQAPSQLFQRVVEACSSALSGALKRNDRSSSRASASLIAHTVASMVSPPSFFNAAMRLWPSITR
jgi:hypothetical protein